MPDAVVIGAGPNGLTAANLLADAGWDVVVFETQPTAGGAVRSAELIRPGCIHDLFSAFYPLAVASPHVQALELERFGLRWRRAPLVAAHPLPDGRCAVLSQDRNETAASLDAFSAGDGDAWLEMSSLWEQVERPLLDALFTPFPPVRPALRLAAALGPSALVRFLRFLALPVRRMTEERFGGDGGKLLLTGHALHGDFSPESPGSGLFGWLLTSLGQRGGFPVPEGGAQALTAALVKRFESRGGRLVAGERVTRVEVRERAAVGVVTASGERVGARRAVLADTSAPALYLDLVGAEHLPQPLLRDIEHFQFDNATVKVDWLVKEPIPWAADEARRAGTIHLPGSMDEFTEAAAQLAMSLIPARPYLVLGQMNVADPTRSPAPSHTVWAYTHVPQHAKGDAAGELSSSWSQSDSERFIARIEAQIEHHAPGFENIIEGRHVMMPPDFEHLDENLVRGALNGGTAQLQQELIFRPTPGLGRSETPIGRLYLASASAHPGGGVHGGPGANAARAALLGSIRGRVAVGATRLIAGGGRRSLRGERRSLNR